MVTTSTSCVSLHRSQSHSPVSRFSKLLRNSFSKLRAKRTSLHVKSRSVDVLKKVCDDENDDHDNNSDIISPINEEMVMLSQKQGLPIIPFPCPSFVILDKNLEETKSLTRENSFKEIKTIESGKSFVQNKNASRKVHCWCCLHSLLLDKENENMNSRMLQL